MHADPKVRKIWLTLAANEYGKLTQGVGGRVKSTPSTSLERRAYLLTGDRMPLTESSTVLSNQTRQKAIDHAS